MTAIDAAARRGLLFALIGRSLVGVGAIGIFLCATPASATMHDAKTCKALKLERTELLRTGIEDNMTKGPYWALDNLEPDQITQIARYLNLDETIMFRCPGGHKPKIKPKIQHTSHKKHIARKNSNKKKITPVSFNPFEGE